MNRHAWIAAVTVVLSLATVREGWGQLPRAPVGYSVQSSSQSGPSRWVCCHGLVPAHKTTCPNYRSAPAGGGSGPSSAAGQLGNALGQAFGQLLFGGGSSGPSAAEIAEMNRRQDEERRRVAEAERQRQLQVKRQLAASAARMGLAMEQSARSIEDLGASGVFDLAKPGSGTAGFGIPSNPDVVDLRDDPNTPIFGDSSVVDLRPDPAVAARSTLEAQLRGVDPAFFQAGVERFDGTREFELHRPLNHAGLYNPLHDPVMGSPVGRDADPYWALSAEKRMNLYCAREFMEGRLTFGQLHNTQQTSLVQYAMNTNATYGGPPGADMADALRQNPWLGNFGADYGFGDLGSATFAAQIASIHDAKGTAKNGDYAFRVPGVQGPYDLAGHREAVREAQYWYTLHTGRSVAPWKLKGAEYYIRVRLTTDPYTYPAAGRAAEIWDYSKSLIRGY